MRNAQMISEAEEALVVMQEQSGVRMGVKRLNSCNSVASIVFSAPIHVDIYNLI